MRKLLSTLAVGAALTLTAGAARAEDAPVTVKGQAVCAKCELHETAKCQDAVKVSDGGKETTYYLADNAVAKKYHSEICKGPKDGVSVTGVVSEKDGKKVITATEIK